MRPRASTPPSCGARTDTLTLANDSVLLTDSPHSQPDPPRDPHSPLLRRTRRVAVMATRLWHSFRRLVNPPFLLFGGVMTPVCILAWNCAPPPVEQLQDEMRARYGYQYEKRTRELNNQALAAMWDARHDDIGRTTLQVRPNATAAGTAGGAAPAAATPAAAAAATKKQ